MFRKTQEARIIWIVVVAMILRSSNQAKGQHQDQHHHQDQDQQTFLLRTDAFGRDLSEKCMQAVIKYTNVYRRYDLGR